MRRRTSRCCAKTSNPATEARRGVVDPSGQSYEVEDLYVADGSILPTSIGVNSQLPIMSMATHLGWRLADKLLHQACALLLHEGQLTNGLVHVVTANEVRDQAGLLAADAREI